MSDTALVGVVSAGALAVRENMKEQDRDIRDVERNQSRLRRTVSLLALSGALQRGLAPAVSDLLAGVAYPAQQPTAAPSPFITVPAAVARPVLADESLVTDASYPPTVNEYDSNGNLIDPSSVQDGQLVALGMSLTFPEVRARLLGMTSATAPTDDDLLQVFRQEQALVQVLGEVRSANGDAARALSYFVSKWRAFFGISAPQPGGSSSPYLKGLIWSLQDDTGAIDATTWTVALEVPLFKGLLAVGEAARLRLFTAPLIAAGGPDLSFRVSIAGTVLGTFVYAAAEGAAGVCLELDITRRADQSGLPRYAAGFTGSAKAVSLALPGALFSANDVDNLIVVEAMWSTGGNAVRFREGTFEKL